MKKKNTEYYCNLGHLLSGCSKSLDRYTFRHDSVLSHLLDTIIKRKKEGVEVFADLNFGGSMEAQSHRIWLSLSRSPTWW